MTDKSGLSRAGVINRSLTAAGSVMLLSQAKTLPAWAGEAAEGSAERMARIAFDPESGRTLVSLLQVDVTTRESKTEWGPTKAAEAVDRVLVKSRGAGPFSRPVDVSAGQPEAKLDPRLAARGGKAGVA